VSATLNPPQREAVEHLDGAALVLAGAGSGKTRVLTHRVGRLLERGVEPWRVLAVTFTNKAAGEMKHRVAEQADGAAEVLVSTFHSACVRFLRRDIEPLGYTRAFSIYDTADQKAVIKQLCKDARIISDSWNPARIRSEIDRAKNKMLTAEAYADTVHDPANPTPRIFRDYTAHLRAANAVDFNDLIGLMVKLLSEHDDIRRRYSRRYRYLMIDEYQDTNRAQYALIRLLASEHGNVMVVGDDDQSIYSFRGADIRNIHDFERDFPNCRVIRLEQNYRSTRRIIALTNALVSNNAGRMEKVLWTENPEGEAVRYLRCSDDEAEALHVVRWVGRLQRLRIPLSQMAVIYRTNAASRVFEQALTQEGIPHLLVGGRKFYERKEVRDILAWLKLIANPADDMAFQRAVGAPPRGLGAKSLDEIRAIGAAQGAPMLAAAQVYADGPRGRGRKSAATFCRLIGELRERAAVAGPGELVESIAEVSGYLVRLRADKSREARQRIDNIAELARAAGEQGDGVEPLLRLQSFLDSAQLSSQADDLDSDPESGRLTLLTAHLAKGLEFDVVFVTGMFEGGFPHFMSLESEEDIEEERRLVYVACTRARKRLLLSSPRRRRMPQGYYADTAPSRFIREMPGELLATEGQRPRSAAAEERAARLARLGLSPDLGSGGLGSRGNPLRRRGQPRLGSPKPQQAPARPPVGRLVTRTPTSAEDFRAGTRVLHATLGAGLIERVEGSASNPRLRVRFDDAGRRTLYARYASLEIIEDHDPQDC